jgi:formamidopyrimidine-DNA glycosylase
MAGSVVVPELPDVEGYRRELAPALSGRRIEQVLIDDGGVLRNTSAAALRRHLNGHVFTAPRRIGKWLILPTDGPILLMHSGMTGRPSVTAQQDEVEQFTRMRVVLDRGELRYRDMRKLRGIWLVDDEEQAQRVIGPIGPDALDLDLRAFRDALAKRRGTVKPTLMDQLVVAGLGNLLTDEICWRARIRPGRPLPDLDQDEIRDLHTAMRQILRTSVRHGCVPGLRGWLTRVRNNPDPACPRCGRKLRRSRIGGRTSLWCPREQSR